MIENLFGGDSTEGDDGGPETEEQEQKTLKGFSLPLETTGNQIDSQVKMPPLPLKSVLRRKRQNLGVKTKTTAVKDLKARDGADGDKIGDDVEEDEEIGAVDPWARFMGDEMKEEDNDKQKKKKEKPKYETQSRGGWGNLPIFLHIRDFLNQYPPGCGSRGK